MLPGCLAIVVGKPGGEPKPEYGERSMRLMAACIAEMLPPVRIQVAEVDWDLVYYLKEGATTQTKVGRLRPVLCDRIALVGSIDGGLVYYHEKGTSRWWAWEGARIRVARPAGWRPTIR
jgi:hypothetical protein